MGLLDGVIQSVIAQSFNFLFLDATLTRQIVTEGEGGEVTESFGEPIPIKAVRERTTQAQRDADGATARDVSLIIMHLDRNGVALGNLKPKDRVELQGVNYVLGAPIEEDPAHATFVARGTPLLGVG